jgi:hypothetical protein
MNLQKHIRKILREEFNGIEIPNVLYHATFSPILKKIKREGLGGPSATPLWTDSKENVVYLAIDPDVAYSYAEAVFDENEDIPESWMEKIIVLEIDTTNLNPNKFYLDRNVLDNDGSTVEYHGIIPFDSIIDVIK